MIFLPESILNSPNTLKELGRAFLTLHTTNSSIALADASDLQLAKIGQYVAEAILGHQINISQKEAEYLVLGKRIDKETSSAIFNTCLSTDIITNEFKNTNFFHSIDRTLDRLRNLGLGFVEDPRVIEEFQNGFMTSLKLYIKPEGSNPNEKSVWIYHCGNLLCQLHSMLTNNNTLISQYKECFLENPLNLLKINKIFIDIYNTVDDTIAKEHPADANGDPTCRLGFYTK